MKNINLENISLRTYTTDNSYFQQLNPHFLDECYELGTQAFGAEYSRPAAEIAYMLGDRATFGARLADPSLKMVAGQANPNQLFGRPTLSVAFSDFGNKDGRIVGFASSADNVSGESDLSRRMKQKSRVKNCRWLSSIAVEPDYQGRGIGTLLSLSALAQAHRLQPATGYAWPEESAAGKQLLLSMGMSVTGWEQADVFGQGDPIRQERLAAGNALGLAKCIANGLKDSDNKLKFTEILKRQSPKQLKRDAADRDWFLKYHTK